MRKKGQAATEFLMTYGWAILAAVIVIGVLWYLIGNPANLVGTTFQISAPLVANSKAISTSNIQLEIRNGKAESINVTTVQITNCATATTSTIVNASKLQTFTVTCSPALTSGDRFNGDVIIKYKTSGSSLEEQATGTISGKVP